MKNKKWIIISAIAIVLIAVMVGIIIFIQTNNKDEIEKITEFNYFTFVQDNKTGIIDKEGNVLIEPTYDAIQIPNPTKPVFICAYNYHVETGDYETKVLNEKNEEIFTQYQNVTAIQIKDIVSEIPYEKRVLKFEQDGKYGLIDFNGKVVVKPIYEELENLSYKEGEFLVKQDGKYGILTDKGRKILDVKYDSIVGDNYYSNKEGYQLGGYIIGQNTESGYRYGYMTAEGKLVLKPEYNKIYRMTQIKEDDNSYLVVEKDGQAGVFKNKEQVIPFQYDSINYDELNNVFIVQQGKKYGVLNKEGQSILPVEYENLVIEGIYIYGDKDNKTMLFDREGKEIKDSSYQSVLATDNEQYYITIDANDQYGVIDKEQNVLIPNQYVYVEYLYEDYFVVGNAQGLSGIVNSKNEEILPIQYEVVQQLEDCKLTQTVLGTTTRLYDSNIKEIMAAENARIYQEENYIKIYSNEKTQYFSLEGKQLTSQEVFPNNTMYAKEQNGKWGFVDKQGNVKVDYQYEQVTELNQYGFAGVKKDGKWGVMKQDGSIVVAPIYTLEDKLNEPDFIGPYYKVVAGYGEIYYTDENEEE